MDGHIWLSRNKKSLAVFLSFDISYLILVADIVTYLFIIIINDNLLK